MPYFKSGTCEQFLEVMDKVHAVMVGQNLTTGPQKVAFMRTVLKGNAMYFNQYFTTDGNEDDATFVLGVQALTSHIFPQRSLRMRQHSMPLRRSALMWLLTFLSLVLPTSGKVKWSIWDLIQQSLIVRNWSSFLAFGV